MSETFKRRKRGSRGGTPLHDAASAEHRPVDGVCDHPDERDMSKAASLSAGQQRQLAQTGHGDVEAARKLITRRARELGRTDLLPDSWTAGKALTSEQFAEALKAASIAHDRPLTTPRVPGGPAELVHIEQQPTSLTGTSVTLTEHRQDSFHGGTLGSSITSCAPAEANVHKLDLTAGTTPRTHGLDTAGHVPGPHPNSSTPFAVRQHDVTTGKSYAAPGQGFVGRVPGEA